MHTLKDYDREPNKAYADPSKLEIHFLTPSEQSNSWYDDVWYKGNMIHEYAHIPFYKDLCSKPEDYKEAPEWFSEGFAEYCKIFASNDKEILEKYRCKLNKIKEMVKSDEGRLVFECKDEHCIYCGGAYIIKYIYETYGQEKVIRLIKSQELSFAKAIEELGVTIREFENNWLKWACKEFNVDAKVYKI